MTSSKLKIIVITLVIQCSGAVFAAEEYLAPKTQWGHPDLQGVWNFASNVPRERPEEFGDRQFLNEEEVLEAQRERLSIGRRREPSRTSSGVEAFYNDTMWMERARVDGVVRTSLLVYPLNGRLPEPVEGISHQPGGERDVPGERPVRFAVGGIGRDGPEDRGLSERCLVGFNAGPQLMPSVYNNNVQIVQNKDYVVIFAEMVHDARLIRLTTGPELDPKVRQWSGDSRGYWDGDTLVITTKNFNGLTQSFEGYGSSKNKVLYERLTRIGPETINYEFTIDDLSTFTDKLTAIITLAKVSAQLYEYACHEGNYGMGNMLRASRNRDAPELSVRVRGMIIDR